MLVYKILGLLKIKSAVALLIILSTLSENITSGQTSEEIDKKILKR